MSGSAEASQKALHTSLMLLNQLENNIPLSGVLIGALEAMIQQSKSRFAFLLHNHSGRLMLRIFSPACSLRSAEPAP